jgi:hypothetical protein
VTTTTQVDKLYQKLTPEELARLAFDASVRGDDDEYSAILSNVGKRTYVCLNQEFSLRLNEYIGLAMFYGMVYWKHRTYMAYAEAAAKGDDKPKDLIFDLLDKVIAMDIALQEVCTKANIDHMAVKKLAGCDDEYTHDKCDNEALVKEYIGLFEGCFRLF